MPIYVGAMSPKGQTQTAEIADGILLTCMDPERFDVIEENLVPGFAKAGNGKSLANFDVAPTVACIIGDDLDACRAPLKFSLALYIGGMGARDKNFYNEYIRRIGYEKEAAEIQNLYLAGKKEELLAAVPDSLVDTLHLVGPPARIRDRFSCGRVEVGTLVVGNRGNRRQFASLAELAFGMNPNRPRDEAARERGKRGDREIGTIGLYASRANVMRADPPSKTAK